MRQNSDLNPQAERSTQEVLAGLVERVTYHNAENGFCVLRAKARGHREMVTVVGHAATIAAGEWITASGEWVNDRTQNSPIRSCLHGEIPTNFCWTHLLAQKKEARAALATLASLSARDEAS